MEGAKRGKLLKLKSVLKRLNSFNKQGRNSKNSVASEGLSGNCTADLHPVYVGKSRRRYLISSDVIDHPIFRELADRSSGDEDIISVPCEVVLFEHLLWMLENADQDQQQEIAEFYAC